MTEVLAPPTVQRGADGRPGANYWQQQADYAIEARLAPATRTLSARATITYHNNSPTPLTSIWLELVDNSERPNSLANRSRVLPQGAIEVQTLLDARAEFEGGGVDLTGPVTDEAGQRLHYVIHGTLLCIDLGRPLDHGGVARVHVAWRSKLSDGSAREVRSGYMVLPDGEPVFHIGHWFPQVVAYTDYGGWRTTPFNGVGEFTPEFGDFSVALTVPAGYVVAATGELTNPGTALNATQRARLGGVQAGVDTEIVSVAEAAAKQSEAGDRVWRFTARRVRDFAFAASLRYSWRATRVPVANGAVLAMTYFPPSAAGLWRPFSLAAIRQTLAVYGSKVFPYPYPVVQAAYGPVPGMEHPMLAFSTYEPDGPDGASYSRERKRDFLWVLIHEVGHNWFPMIVNSDERAWTWMDEGLNSFVEQQATFLWSADYATRPNAPRIEGLEAVTAPHASHVAANAVSDLFGTQYHRPAAALLVLRETILDRERFDRAFRAYAHAWAFKRPTPSDFFRMMDQETGSDLAWFWRSWFLETGHVDLALDGIARLKLHATAAKLSVPPRDFPIADATVLGNELAGIEMRVRAEPDLADDYDLAPASPPPEADRAAIARLQIQLDRLAGSGRFYEIRIRNVGGTLSAIPLLLRFDDGKAERLTLAPQVWQRDDQLARVILWRPRAIRDAIIDPNDETGDTDITNNSLRAPIGDEDINVAAVPGPKIFVRARSEEAVRH